MVATRRIVDTASVAPLRVAFVSTHAPRQCGIATFTQDLAGAIRAVDPAVRVSWAAIDEPDSQHLYGREVLWRIRQGDPASYRAAAEHINGSSVDVVSLQHEFGLYGNWDDVFEDHLREFLDVLQKPLVTTLHTVLPEPTPSVREAVQRLADKSTRVVAMADVACDILVKKYALDPARLIMVPHGVPPVARRGRTRLKQRLGLANHTLISTFGLVDPRKGLEYAIRAMPRIRDRHPDALYAVIGRTHPEFVRRHGEAYRQQLVALVDKLGLRDHVTFVDRYLDQREVLDYLLASDVYVTPYLDPYQITSGTLAYALGTGNAIVSTPYLHAREALAGGRGLLVEFRSEVQLADAILAIIEHPNLKDDLERKAYAYGRLMGWPVVGRSMVRLLRSVAAPPTVFSPTVEPARRPRPVWPSQAAGPLARTSAAPHEPGLIAADEAERIRKAAS